MTNTVALQKCYEYNFEEVYKSILTLLDLVPPPDFVGKTVLLKPNILYPKKPELAVCTHPVVVGAAVKAFVDKGAGKVLVGEAPAIANSTHAAKTVGMYDQVVANGGEWADFSKSVEVPCPNGKIVPKFNFAEPFLQADLVVSLSKLKSHQFMSYTGAMKNLFGLMVGLEKAEQHYRFPNKETFGEFLTDLNISANAQYAIMDAIVGMEGNGPTGGTPRPIGAILASANPHHLDMVAAGMIGLNFLAASDNILALDWKCASLVGYNPHRIPNLDASLKRGVWLSSEKDITTIGENESNCKCPNFKIVKNPSKTLQIMIPGWVNFIAKKFFEKRAERKANTVTYSIRKVED